MPSNTTNFALPYPNGSDSPCDFAQQWCDFTEAIQGVLDGFQDTLDRTVPVIPIAVLAVTENVTISNFDNIVYDTVMIDSAGWTAVDVDNTLLSPDMAGVLSFSTNGLFTQTNAPGSFHLDPQDSTGAVGEPQLPYREEMDMDTVPVGIPLEALFFSDGNYVPGSSGIRNNASISAGSVLTVEDAIHAMYWHADGGTV
jgi:hypothetical protein